MKYKDSTQYGAATDAGAQLPWRSPSPTPRAIQIDLPRSGIVPAGVLSVLGTDCVDTADHVFALSAGQREARPPAIRHTARDVANISLRLEQHAKSPDRRRSHDRASGDRMNPMPLRTPPPAAADRPVHPVIARIALNPEQVVGAHACGRNAQLRNVQLLMLRSSCARGTIRALADDRSGTRHGH